MTQSVHLFVDVGNSRIKWNSLPVNESAFQDTGHAFAWSLATLAEALDQHWESLQAFVVKVSVSNVAGEEVSKVISQWCVDHWNVQPRFASTTTQFADIENGYDDYQELGVDRWLAVIAAHRLYPSSINIVIDCGSAITIDTIFPSGEHRAGPILSGRQTLLESLLAKAGFSDELAKSGFVASEIEQHAELPQVFVSNTKEAVLSGAKFATSGALEAIVTEIKTCLDQSPGMNIIATGGGAQNVLALSKLSTRKNYIYEPDLVLKGLAYFYDVNDE